MTQRLAAVLPTPWICQRLCRTSACDLPALAAILRRIALVPAVLLAVAAAASALPLAGSSSREILGPEAKAREASAMMRDLDRWEKLPLRLAA